MNEQSFIQIEPDGFPDPDTPAKLRNGTMICPCCGGTYLHVVKVDVAPVGPARQRVVASAKGIDMIPEDHAADTQRGNETCISFDCESGCRFTIVFMFHKGNVYCSFRDVVPYTLTDDPHAPEPEWRGDLWRD